jgi:hypothetical protein
LKCVPPHSSLPDTANALRLSAAATIPFTKIIFATLSAVSTIFLWLVLLVTTSISTTESVQRTLAAAALENAIRSTEMANATNLAVTRIKMIKRIKKPLDLVIREIKIKKAMRRMMMMMMTMMMKKRRRKRRKINTAAAPLVLLDATRRMTNAMTAKERKKMSTAQATATCTSPRSVAFLIPLLTVLPEVPSTTRATVFLLSLTSDALLHTLSLVPLVNQRPYLVSVLTVRDGTRMTAFLLLLAMLAV